LCPKNGVPDAEILVTHQRNAEPSCALSVTVAVTPTIIVTVTQKTAVKNVDSLDTNKKNALHATDAETRVTKQKNVAQKSVITVENAVT
jgi:hypothetical protein